MCVIYSIGHSNRSIEQFLGLLKAHGIKKVVDVRTIPGSRHNPQFNKEMLRAALKKIGIHYEHLKVLGGLRKTQKGSVNLGWKNLSFRGFADYMQTSEFAKGLNRVRTIARKQKTVIMCAEAVPWHCHRSLIADALVKNGLQVLHIQSRKTAVRHKLTPFLKIRGGNLVYP